MSCLKFLFLVSYLRVFFSYNIYNMISLKWYICKCLNVIYLVSQTIFLLFSLKKNIAFTLNINKMFLTKNIDNEEGIATPEYSRRPSTFINVCV